MHHSLVTLATLGLSLSVIAATQKTCNSLFASGWFNGCDPSLSPAEISWSKYNSVTFTFAMLTNNSSVINLEPASVLSSLVGKAHRHGVNITLSIGGAGNLSSWYFSSAVNPKNSSKFVDAIVGLVSRYDLNGIEFDWEFPGVSPASGPNISLNDSAHFLTFLQALRKSRVGRNITLSAAVPLKPWVGLNGSPMTNVSSFASVLDYISIMNYDVFGPWSPDVGPNAPLNDSCAPASDQQGSAVSAIAAWTNAKFPRNQIVLGVPSYGYSYRVAPSNAFTASGVLASYPPFNKTNQPLIGPAPGRPPIPGLCPNPVESTPSSTPSFKSLIEDGYLTANGTNATGIDYIFDRCSMTPYIYNAGSQIMISYDNARSFEAKGKFIVDNGLKGYNMWLLSDDSNNILVDSINSAISCAS